MSSTDILGYPTLIDVVKEYSSMDANAVYLKAAQVLNRRCPFIKLLPMIRSNQIISHIGSRDNYIGTITPKALGQFTTPTATSSVPYTEPISLFEDYGVVPFETYRIQNSPDQWRFNQDRRKIEGIGQSVEYNMFYDSIAANAGGFNGLFTRFNSLTSRPNADTSWPYNVIGAGGTGADTMSAVFIEMGEDKVYGLYPANVNGQSLPAGLNIRNLGEATQTNSSGQERQVLRTHFQFFIGLGIGDERCVQRLANIESTGSSNTFDPYQLIQLKNQLPGMGEDPATFLFVNRTLKTQMEQYAVDKVAGFTTMVNALFGGPVTAFHNVPVVCADKLTITETAIS